MTRWHVHDEPLAATLPDFLQFCRQHFDVPVPKKCFAGFELYE
jgi:hypothetical protein